MRIVVCDIRRIPDLLFLDIEPFLGYNQSMEIKITISRLMKSIESCATVFLMIAAFIFAFPGVSQSLVPVGDPVISGGLIQSPGAGKIYHGVYPGGITGEEDDITLADVQSYEAVSGLHAAWVYFSNNWYRSRLFPAATAQWIADHGSVPYVRMMLRSSPNPANSTREKLFTLQAIINGDFDADLNAWGTAAKAFGGPLIVEYGTECNGNWFCWNGMWNGADRKTLFGDIAKADGPERFVAAYRHIVDTIRNQGANNITWVFHVNYDAYPVKAWNDFENYYPGDAYVDWVAVSDYGPQTPKARDTASFRENLDGVYSRLTAMAPGKPIIVAEFGCTATSKGSKGAPWGAYALNDLIAGQRWPAIIGFSWWNEHWENDNKPINDTTMRLQDNPKLAFAFKSKLVAGPDLLALNKITTFAYQLQNIENSVETDALALSDYDMLVIEPTSTVSGMEDYDIAGTVAMLKAMPAGDMTHRKMVIAYVDLGQAETWRYYWTWSTKWNKGQPKPADWPGYILTPDPDGWSGDYNVAYWDVAWKDILINGLIDEAVVDGFDGVYLDWIEAYDDPAVMQAANAAGVDPKTEMIKLIGELRDYARTKNPKFIVIQQNGTTLLNGHAELLNVIDGIGQEDVWYMGRPGAPWSRSKGYDIAQDPDFSAELITWLDQFLAAGKTVLTIDYTVKHAASTYLLSRGKGYVPYCTRIDLSHLSTTPPPAK